MLMSNDVFVVFAVLSFLLIPERVLDGVWA